MGESHLKDRWESRRCCPSRPGGSQTDRNLDRDHLRGSNAHRTSRRDEDRVPRSSRSSRVDAVQTYDPAGVSSRETEAAYVLRSEAAYRPYGSSIASTTDALNSLGLADSTRAPSAYSSRGNSDFTTTPRAASPNRNVRATHGSREQIDSSYVVRKDDYKKFFRVGRVFATLWTDAVGDAGKVDQTFVSPVIYGEKVFTKIRRFVVAREGDRSVTCHPVTSYNGAAITKKDIRRNEHGFIHSKTVGPQPMPGMLPKSLRVILSKGAPPLSENSLVNYGKVYTVETNVKVKDIGDLDRESRQTLRHYFKQVLFNSPSEDDVGGPSHEDLMNIGGASFSGASVVGSAYSSVIPSPYAGTQRSIAYPSVTAYTQAPGAGYAITAMQTPYAPAIYQNPSSSYASPYTVPGMDAKSYYEPHQRSFHGDAASSRKSKTSGSGSGNGHGKGKGKERRDSP